MHCARHRSRKKLREFCRYYEETGQSEEEKWFFDPFVPDRVTVRELEGHRDIRSPWESLPTEVLKREQQCWNFHPEAKWHGYAGYVDGYAMVDPNKLALLTPGINRRPASTWPMASPPPSWRTICGSSASFPRSAT